MKKLLLPLAMILLVATSCLAAPAILNKPPIAYVDSVSPTSSVCGDAVTFKGHGIDPDGTVVAYSWRSSPEGDLSNEASFTTSSLAAGSHTIWFKVQDNNGAWSDEVMAVVNVVAAGATKPVISSFTASPGGITPGGSSTLSWNVTGCTNVVIDQSIGTVSSSGSRVVKPVNTTIYTLRATNEVGTVTATAQIVITSTPISTVELFSLAAEDGYVRQDGQIGDGAIVGYTANIIGIQGFLSFDISGIPKGVNIKSVSIDLDAGAVQIVGDPFVKMGQLSISKYTFTKLNSNSYFIGPTLDAICSFSKWPSDCLNSSLTTAALQEQLDAGSNRFQVRMRFNKTPTLEPYGTRWSESANREANNLDFSNAKPKLVVQYEY
jgi:hypothetical protein